MTQGITFRRMSVISVKTEKPNKEPASAENAISDNSDDLNGLLTKVATSVRTDNKLGKSQSADGILYPSCPYTITKPENNLFHANNGSVESTWFYNSRASTLPNGVGSNSTKPSQQSRSSSVNDNNNSNSNSNENKTSSLPGIGFNRVHKSKSDSILGRASEVVSEIKSNLLSGMLTQSQPEDKKVGTSPILARSPVGTHKSITVELKYYHKLLPFTESIPFHYTNDDDRYCVGLEGLFSDAISELVKSPTKQKEILAKFYTSLELDSNYKDWRGNKIPNITIDDLANPPLVEKIKSYSSYSTNLNKEHGLTGIIIGSNQDLNGLITTIIDETLASGVANMMVKLCDTDHDALLHIRILGDNIEIIFFDSYEKSHQRAIVNKGNYKNANYTNFGSEKNSFKINTATERTLSAICFATNQAKDPVKQFGLKVIRNSPESPEVLHDTLLACFQAERFDMALEHLAKIPIDDPLMRSFKEKYLKNKLIGSHLLVAALKLRRPIERDNEFQLNANTQVVDWLINNGVSVDSYVHNIRYKPLTKDTPTTDAYNPLKTAIICGDLAIVKHLIEVHNATVTDFINDVAEKNKKATGAIQGQEKYTFINAQYLKTQKGNKK